MKSITSISRLFRSVVVLILIVTVHVYPQSCKRGSPKDQLSCGIAHGDPGSIIAAGDSGDRDFIAVLRLQLKKRMHDPNYPSTKAIAQIALAKLDDSRTLQELRCEAAVGNAETQYELATYKLPKIGGAFAVKIYLLLLDSDSEFLAAAQRAARKKDPLDAPYAPMSSYVISHLPEVVLNPPPATEVDASVHTLEARANFWREWLDRHQAEWERRKPVGASVDYKNLAACRQHKSR